MIGTTEAAPMVFESKEHESFFWKYLVKCRRIDVYHAALIYCLGVDALVRGRIHRVFDFKEGRVRPECLEEKWQTLGSKKTVRLAFHLYSGGMPEGQTAGEAAFEELQHYTVSGLFSCEYAPYFWQAVKLRYPEYCGQEEGVLDVRKGGGRYGYQDQ